MLAPVVSYVNATTCFEGDARRAATQSFEDSRKAVISYLAFRGANLYFLFDAMDNYPVRNQTFSKIFSGLFQALNKVSDDSSRIQVTFCVPEEVEEFMSSASTNLRKR